MTGLFVGVVGNGRESQQWCPTYAKTPVRIVHRSVCVTAYRTFIQLASRNFPALIIVLNVKAECDFVALMHWSDEMQLHREPRVARQLPACIFHQAAHSMNVSPQL